MDSVKFSDQLGSDVELNESVYQQLKRLAHGMMISERAGHTLSPTDLVHEAFLKLSKSGLSFKDEQHYFRTLARQMRRFLVDYGRGRSAKKKQGVAVYYTDSLGLSDNIPDFCHVDSAIDELREMDQRSAESIELVYFAALPQDKAAHYMQISLATLERDLKFGRAFINEYIHNLAASE